jgi:hypothetical protein
MEQLDRSLNKKSIECEASSSTLYIMMSQLLAKKYFSTIVVP